MSFSVPQKVLFRHCNPAGIVFYPRYFEMINDATEAFFDQALSCPWEVLHQTAAVPTVEITTRFSAPSKHGDDLIISIAVTQLGRSSLTLQFDAVCGQEPRFAATSTLVRVDTSGRPQAWPDDMRAALTAITGEVQ